MDGCAPHLGRNCVQSEGCNAYTRGPCHRDDLLFSEFRVQILTLWVFPCELQERNESTVIKSADFSVHDYNSLIILRNIRAVMTQCHSVLNQFSPVGGQEQSSMTSWS